jgi:four helix bundle protein
VGEQSEQLKARTNQFALGVIGLLKDLPGFEPGPTIRRQLAKSATSVAANYRAACRARSRAEFIARLGVVAEEADESLFWLKLALDAGLVRSEQVSHHLAECRELVAVFSASLGTARRNHPR